MLSYLQCFTAVMSQESSYYLQLSDEEYRGRQAGRTETDEYKGRDVRQCVYGQKEEDGYKNATREGTTEKKED